MTTIKGTAYQTANVRSAPKVVSSPSNIVGKLYNGNKFTGEKVTAGAETWIKLATVNGQPVSGEQYVASWVVNWADEAPTTPQPTDPFVTAQMLDADGKVIATYSMTKVG